MSGSSSPSIFSCKTSFTGAKHAMKAIISRKELRHDNRYEIG